MLLTRTGYVVQTNRTIQRNDPRGCENRPLDGLTAPRRFATLVARSAPPLALFVASTGPFAPTGALQRRGRSMLLSWPVMWALAVALLVMSLTR